MNWRLILALMGCAAFWTAVAAQTMPPARFQHAPDKPFLALYLPWKDLTRRCGGATIIGCEYANTIAGGPAVVILPEPCEWARASGDRFAVLACHEEAHVNTWPADHPK